MRVAEYHQRNHRERIRLIHESRQDVPYARNLGIQEAHGKFGALLDNDDLMYPYRLRGQKTIFEVNREVFLVYGSYDTISFDNETVLRNPE